MKTRQTVASAALLYAAYITYKCPCARINGCHKSNFLLSVGLASAIVAYDWMQ